MADIDTAITSKEIIKITAPATVQAIMATILVTGVPAVNDSSSVVDMLVIFISAVEEVVIGIEVLVGIDTV